METTNAAAGTFPHVPQTKAVTSTSWGRENFRSCKVAKYHQDEGENGRASSTGKERSR